MQATIGRRARGLLAAGAGALALVMSLAAAPGVASATHYGLVTCTGMPEGRVMEFSVNKATFGLPEGTVFRWRSEVWNSRENKWRFHSRFFVHELGAGWPSLSWEYQSWSAFANTRHWPVIDVDVLDRGVWKHRGDYRPQIQVYGSARYVSPNYCYFP